MKLISVFKSSIIVFAFLCLSQIVSAAPGDPDGDPDPGTSVPFDFGLSILVAAGVGYAAKKRYDAKNKETVEDENGA